MSKEHQLYNHGLGLFGRVTSTLSHEMSNMVAIIHQRVGLLQDMMDLAEQGSALDLQKIRMQCERITDQVRRGRQLVAHMNEFAHSIDESLTSIGLNDLLVSTARLTSRLAELRKTSIEVKCDKPSVSVVNNPFHVRLVLHTIVELLLCGEGTKGPIELSLSELTSAAEAVVQARGYHDGIFEDEGLAHAKLLATEIGAELEVAGGKGKQIVLTLRLPAMTSWERERNS